MDARKSRFAPNTPDPDAPKAQDTWSVLPEMVAFKDPLTLDIGYLSSLKSSFVIENQANARTEVCNRRPAGYNPARQVI